MEPQAQFRPAPRFVGVFVIMIGVGLIGMTRLHPEKVRTDLWVGWAVGAVFALAGALILISPPPGTPPEKIGPLQHVFGASIFTLFAAIMAWWAFLAKGGATRMSLGPVSFSLGARWAWLGKIPIALFAALCAVGAAVAWKSALDAAERKLPGSRAPLAALLIGALGWAGVKLFRPPPPPAFGAPVVEVPLMGSMGAKGAGAASVHGSVVAGPDGAAFGGGADWLDYPLPAAARLDGGGALELEARAEPRRGRALSPAVTLAAAGPFVIDAYPGRDSWVVSASAGDCSVRSDELVYGRWTKIALAYDAWSGVAVLFVDGRREAQTACLGPLPAARGDTLRLGTWHAEYQAFTGSLRMVRLYPRAAL